MPRKNGLVRFNGPVIIYLIIITLAIPFLFASIGSIDASDTASPEVQISFERPIKQTPSSQRGELPLTFNVTVSCKYPQVVPMNSTIEVILSTKASWWNITEAPPITFDIANNVTTFLTTIMVPPNSSADIDILFEVWGTWDYMNGGGAGEVEKRYAVIDVLPFFDMFIGSNEPVKYADVGDWVTYTFNITNRANTGSNISFHIKRDGSVIDHRIEDDGIYLEKGETRVIEIEIRQRPSASRKNTVHVIAEFEDDAENSRFDLPLELRTSPTLSTFFYERNFMFLVSVILLIGTVATILYIVERVKGKHEEDPSLMEDIVENDIN